MCVDASFVPSALAEPVPRCLYDVQGDLYQLLQDEAEEGQCLQQSDIRCIAQQLVQVRIAVSDRGVKSIVLTSTLKVVCDDLKRI